MNMDKIKLTDIYPFSVCNNSEELNSLILLILKDYIIDFSTTRISKVYRIDEDQLKCVLDHEKVSNFYLQLIKDQENTKINQDDLKQFIIDKAVTNIKVAMQRGNISASTACLKILKDFIIDASDRDNYELIMKKLETLNEAN